MAKFGGFVSPLSNIDAARDQERQGARNFSGDAATYANKAGLGDLMSEMLNGLVVSRPEKPVDFLIDLLAKRTAPRYCVVGPPGFATEGVAESIFSKYNLVLVSLPPLLEEARERIVDGLTLAQHCEGGKALPDYIVVKLLAERLSKPDCAEKGWLLEGIPATKGQSQQLVAAGFVPDKVVFVTAPDDNIIKAVPAEVEGVETSQEERKKELQGKLQAYRWEIEKVAPVFAHVSKVFESASVTMSPEQLVPVYSFLDEKPADPGLKDVKMG